MLFGDGSKGNKFADAGVGKNNIEAAFYLRDCLVETIKVGQQRNVSLNSRHVRADCLHGIVEFLLTTARDEDIRTLFDENLCRSKSNPFCTASDDGGLAFEPFGHRMRQPKIATVCLEMKTGAPEVSQSTEL